jgi:hypothetical protein
LSFSTGWRSSEDAFKEFALVWFSDGWVVAAVGSAGGLPTYSGFMGISIPGQTRSPALACKFQALQNRNVFSARGHAFILC